jgi:hypothetical protein
MEQLPAPIEEQSTEVVVYDDGIAAQIDQDTEFVKHKLKSLLEQGQEAFAVIVEVAKTEESPRAFEVVSTMMGQMKDVAMGILDAEGKRQKLKAGLGEEGQGAQTVNNTQNNTTVFVGTTADLQRMLDQEEPIDVEVIEKEDEE